MLPVMLVCRARLTFVIVALSLAALLIVVSSAKPQAGASGGSDKLALNATKGPRRNLVGPRSNQGGSSGMTKSGVSAETNVNSRDRSNSRILSNGSVAETLSWNEGSISSTSSSKISKGKNAGNKEEGRHPAFWSEDIQVGCKELRARSYITDGFCTSEKAIKEVVCAGHCLPIMNMPWYVEFVKTLAMTKLKDWQCVEDVVRKKRVKLLCQNGTSKHYRIKVVKSCKCKKITNKHNKTWEKSRKRTEQKTQSNNGT